MYSLESFIGGAFMCLGGALLLIWTFVWLADKVFTQIVRRLKAMPPIWSGVPMSAVCTRKLRSSAKAEASGD